MAGGAGMLARTSQQKQLLLLAAARCPRTGATHPSADCSGSRCTERPLSVLTPSLGFSWKLAEP